MDTIRRILFFFPFVSTCALVFRNVLPFQVYLFFFAFLAYFSFLFFIYSPKAILNTIFQSFKSGLLIFIIGGIYLIAVFLSKFENPLAIKELFRVFTIFMIYISLNTVSEIKGISFTIYNFISTYLVFLFAVIAFVFFQAIFSELSVLGIIGSYDYNIFAMYMLIGIVFISFLLLQKPKFTRNLVFYNLFLVVLSVLVLFSSSRRGIIVLGFLFAGIVLYSLFSKKFKLVLLKFSVFFSVLVILFVFTFLVVKKPEVRYYLKLEFPQSSTMVSIENFFRRYSSIFNKSVKSNTYFSNSSLVDSYLRRNLTERINKSGSIDKNYYNTLHSLAFFSGSKDELSKIYSDALKLNDSVFDRQMLDKLPWWFNVDFDFEGVFVPHYLNNCLLQDFDLKGKDTVFCFSSINQQSPSEITAAMPVCDSSLFTMEFLYYHPGFIPGVDFVKSKKTKDNFEIVLDTAFRINDLSMKRRVQILVKKSGYRTIDILLSFKSFNLCISDIQWSRKRVSKEILKTYSKISVKKKERETLLSNLLAVEKQNVKQEINCQTLGFIHSDFVKSQAFSVYKNSKVIESYETSAKFKSSDTSLGYIKKLLPTVPGNTYVLSFVINVSQNNFNYTIKRFPERKSEYVKMERFVTPVIALCPGGFQIVDSFKLLDCSSLQSLLVIGARGQDTIEISDFTYKIYPCTFSYELSKLQRQQAYRLMDKTSAFALNNEKSALKIRTKYLKDSLQNYYGYSIEMDDSILLSSRLERWKFAYSYFLTLSAGEKVFGDRLKYLDVYPVIYCERNGVVKEYDYPHNPIISSFLYSGIVGGICYLIALFIILYKFIKYRKDLLVMLAAYTIAFIFAFFSGNSHFSIPLFAIISLFPFLQMDNKSTVNRFNN